MWYICGMLEEQKNIIEPLAAEFINNALMLRYDICTCQLCRDDMLAYIVSKIPPEHASPPQGASPPRGTGPQQRGAAQQTVMEQARFKYGKEISRVVLAAVETVSKNPSHGPGEDKNRSFKSLLEQIVQDRGLDFRQYHQGVIKRKIAMRMRVNKLESYPEYGRLLTKRPEEFNKLLEDLCINVSEFFRDREVWVTVKYLLENLIKQKKLKAESSLRFWSAGCANGEEPYSLAILLQEISRAEPQGVKLELAATDIDKKALLTAQAGVYPKENLKNVTAKELKSYFIALDDGRYQAKNEIRDMVKFQYLDLIRDDIIREADVVICRNVFIYFKRSLQEQLLMKFHRALKAGGYLIMGRSETLLDEAKEIFREIDLNARIYQKK